ncbi:MAG: type II toxin-antitoxin system RelE/ParE family toxin [Mycobacteriales bacterium]
MGEQQWEVAFSEEVADWYLGLHEQDVPVADRVIELLKTRGPMLGMPHSKGLGKGLRELRFTCENVARRITYYWDDQRRAITLTTFGKQRQNEQREVTRATQSMRRHQEGR